LKIGPRLHGENLSIEARVRASTVGFNDNRAGWADGALSRTSMGHRVIAHLFCNTSDCNQTKRCWSLLILEK
jgi:hypothetical protein